MKFCVQHALKLKSIHSCYIPSGNSLPKIQTAKQPTSHFIFSSSNRGGQGEHFFLISKNNKSGFKKTPGQVVCRRFMALSHTECDVPQFEHLSHDSGSSSNWTRLFSWDDTNWRHNASASGREIKKKLCPHKWCLVVQCWC